MKESSKRPQCDHVGLWIVLVLMLCLFAAAAAGQAWRYAMSPVSTGSENVSSEKENSDTTQPELPTRFKLVPKP